LNSNSYFSEITYSGTGTVIFTGLKFGDGYSIIGSNNGCTSSANDCGVVALTNSSSKATNSGLTEEIKMQGLQTKVTAAPNPFNNKIRFSITPGVSGRGSLELYNVLGQRVKTVFEGQVQKGQVQTIEYNVPSTQRTNLIYMFRVGNERISGKLIGLK
jgi:hypothetical protein